MNQENVKEFTDKVRFINKELAEYVNDEIGVKYMIPTPHLLVRIEYTEATEKEKEQLLFNQAIDKLEYNWKMTNRPVVKSTITKDEKDNKTIIDSEVKVYTIWNVSNGLNLRKSFTDKEEALKLYDEINSKVLEAMGVND